MIDREAAFIHDFFEVPIAESVAELPTHTYKNDFILVMPPFEWI
jgi:hypothetical protein